MSIQMNKISNKIMFMEDKSNKLYELRKEKGLSQRTAAQQFFVSQATYYNWEAHKTEPSFEQLLKIADFYDVTVDYLLGRDDSVSVTPFNEQLPKDAQQLLSMYSEFTAEQKEAVLNLLRSFTSKK